MSEAKVCEVCGRHMLDCYRSAGRIGRDDCYRRGYERERAAREKAEAERDAAKALAKEYRDNWIAEEARRIRIETDPARKESALS